MLEKANSGTYNTTETLARVSGICTHNFAGVHHPFLYIEWMKKNHRLRDPLLQLDVVELFGIDDDSVSWPNFVSVWLGFWLTCTKPCRSLYVLLGPKRRHILYLLVSLVIETGLLSM